MTLDPSPSLIEQPRSADDIAAVLRLLLDNANFANPDIDPLCHGLVRIAARYGEIVTQCLNAAPDVHLKAFTKLLGGHPRPAAAARVHVSFKPASGRASASVVVPMNTRLAAAPVEGDTEPVVFETQADLELVRAEPVKAFFVEAGHQRVADVSSILSAEIDGDPLTALAPVTNALYIGWQDVFGLQGLQRVRLRVGVQETGSRDASSRLQWAAETPDGELPLTVESDTTDGLTHSGEVVLLPPSEWLTASVHGITSCWLKVRLRKTANVPASTMRWRPPCLTALDICVIAGTDPQPILAAFQDGVPLDISKDFFPFGERPRFGAVFQVLCTAFSKPGAKVEMLVRLTNPEGSLDAPIPLVSREGRPVVVWEMATSNGFRALAANDRTRSLTQNGSLTFTVPDDVGDIAIAGESGPWLRARLASGNYGSATATDSTVMSMMCAPAIHSIAVRWTLESGPLKPEHLVSQGALTSTKLNPLALSSVDAFTLPDVDGPVLYIALDSPTSPTPTNAQDSTAVAERSWPALKKGRTISWHVRPAPPVPPLALTGLVPSGPAPRWQVHGSDGWQDVAVNDGSAGLTRSGIVTLSLKNEPRPWRDSDLDPEARWAWLRILWPEERPAHVIAKLPVGLCINSVAARQSQRLRDELVGSSNGRADQVFTALRTPIVGSVLLQVREGDNDWVTWQEVETLSSSHAASRHFTFDRSTGEIRFGDGLTGRIPPPGANNVCLREYATGGGRRGNVPARAIAKLRSAVPAVESVINLEPANGGLDADDAAQVGDLALAWVRHRDRAICSDDYADLAVKASPEVARAFCVSGRDLTAALPTGAHEPPMQAGVVSCVVVPQSTALRPQPSFDLLATVKTYLDARRTPVGRLVIVGPFYAHVAVKVHVTCRSGYSAHGVVVECERRIALFLHPLNGGSKGRGWAMGQRPHRSDIYGLLAAIDGVETVRGLNFSMEAPAGMPFIVAAGAIDVACE